MDGSERTTSFLEGVLMLIEPALWASCNEERRSDGRSSIRDKFRLLPEVDAVAELAGDVLPTGCCGNPCRMITG